MPQNDDRTRALAKAEAAGLVSHKHSSTIAKILGELRLSVQSARPRGVAAVALSERGEKLASVHYDNRVRLWDLRLGKLDRELRWFDEDSSEFDEDGNEIPRIEAVAVNRDATRVAGGTRWGRVQVWNTETAEVILKVEAGGGRHGDFFSPVALSRTGDVLAMGNGYDIQMYDVRLWNMGSRSPRRTNKGHVSVVTSIAMSSDGDVIASTSLDGNVQVYEGRSNRESEMGVDRWQGSGREEPGAIAISGDGNCVARLYQDATVQRWDLQSGNILAPIELDRFSGAAMAMSSDQTVLVVGSLIFDMGESERATQYPIRIFEGTSKSVVTLDSHSEVIHSLSLSGSGHLIASASLDGSLKLWLTKERRCLATLLAAGPGEWFISTPDGNFTGSQGMVQSVQMKFGLRGIVSGVPDWFRMQGNPERIAEAFSSAFALEASIRRPHPRLPKGRARRLLPPG